MTHARLSALACLFLLSSIAGCGNQPPVVEIRYEQIYIPDSMLPGCPGVDWNGGPWQAVADLAEARRTALKDCDARFAAARAYQDRLRAMAKEAASKPGP